MEEKNQKKDKMICFRVSKEKKRKLLLYAYDNDTTIQEIFEDYADRLIEEMEADEQGQELK